MLNNLYRKLHILFASSVMLIITLVISFVVANTVHTEKINESTATYIVGDKATLELTISSDIKKYYEKHGEEPLLSSLKKTFTEYSDFCTDYKLIIE